MVAEPARRVRHKQMDLAADEIQLIRDLYLHRFIGPHKIARALGWHWRTVQNHTKGLRTQQDRNIEAHVRARFHSLWGFDDDG